MELKKCLRTRRTIRKFKQISISKEVLYEIIDDGRLAPSGANLQPIKFVAVNDKTICEKIFANVKWAGYTAPSGVPSKKEAPTAYITVKVDKKIKENGDNDASYAGENIILSAWDKGIGSCIIGAFDRTALNELFSVSDSEYIHTVIALGYPAQLSEYEDNDDTVKYYLDEKDNFHVPKRSMNTVADFSFCN